MSDLVAVDATNYSIARLHPDALIEILRESIGETNLDVWDFDIIKVPAGGALQWEIPSLTGKPTYKPAIEGIIIHIKTIRSYWQERFSGSGSPPDCSSPDGIAGYGNPGGTCRQCPMAKFGSSEDGFAQACKEQRLFFLLPEESLLPVILKGPPSSLSALKSFTLRLAAAGKRPSDVITRFTLERATNHAGIAYARIVPQVVGVVSDDISHIIRAYARQFQASIEGVPWANLLSDDKED